MRKIVLIAFITTLMTGCIPFLPGYGGGRPSQEYYRDEPITVTAVTTLTGHITAEADPITETTIIPVTTITLSMTTTRKTITPNIRRIIRTKNIRSITMMIRSSAEKASGGIEKAYNDAVLYNCYAGRGAFHLAMSRFFDLTK